MEIQEYSKTARTRAVQVTSVAVANELLEMGWIDAFHPPMERRGKLIFDGSVTINTLEGDLSAPWDCWVAEGVQGEHYLIQEDVFEQSYRHAPPPAETVPLLMASNLQAEVFDSIQQERRRQDRIWGGPEHDDQHDSRAWMGIVSAQFAAMINAVIADGQHGVHDSAVSIAAVCVAWLEARKRLLYSGRELD